MMSLLASPSLWISIAVPSVIAVVLYYWEHTSRLKEQKETGKSFKLLMKYLETLKAEMKQWTAQQSGQITAQQNLKQQELLQKKAAQQWRQIVDLGRAAKWFIERSDDDEDDYEEDD